jgi:glycosyltransferase involved in cell wall biosynthesis
MQPLRVTIVTPSFNSAPFLEEAIESVLAQDYPAIEYLVMDAGSADGTLPILERYRGRIRYWSEPDQGAADAINRGFRLGSGAIVAWLNADDRYLPGAVRAAVEHLQENPAAAVAYGEAYWTDEAGRVLGPYPTVKPFDPAMFSRECAVCQPACFMRRSAMEDAGWLDAALHSAFDYDLWIRLARRHPFTHVPAFLAYSRMHRANKSLGQRRQVFEESMAVLRRHYGYVPVNWVYGYLCYRLDGRDQFFEPLRHSPLAYLASLFVGAGHNRRHAARYAREWVGRIGALARRPKKRVDGEGR